MARRHKFAGASASIRTELDAKTIGQLCEVAAKEAETLQVLVRLEESTAGKLAYSNRSRVTAGRVELMTFEVTLREANGCRQVKTTIRSYKQKRSFPFPWQMISWSNYKRFMYKLAEEISRADPAASTSVVELAKAA